MSIIIEILKIIFSLSPLAMLLAMIYHLNLERKERAYQIITVIISFIYIFIVALFVKEIIIFFTWLLSFLPFEINLSSLTKLRYLSIIIYNSLLLLGFVICKWLSKKIVIKLSKNYPEIINKMTKTIYDYHLENKQWFLKNENIALRSLSHYIFTAMIIFSTILIIMTKYFDLNNLYPALILIVIGEVTYFIGGYTKKEYYDLIQVDDEISDTYVNYSMLINVLKEQFKNRLLTANSKFREDNKTTGINNYLETLSTSENHLEKITGLYFHQLLQEKDLEISFINSVVEILKGQNIIFATPFYHDLTDYLFFALNRSLLLDNKILFICDRSYYQDVLIWARSGFEAVSKLPYLYKIDLLKKGSDDLDVAIVLADELYQFDLFESSQAFLTKVTNIVTLEPSNLITNSQIGFYLLAKQLANNVQYTFFDRNIEGLVDSLSHMLEANIIEVTPTTTSAPTTSYMVWKADGNNLHHQLFNSIARYLGVGSELAAVALKYDLKEVDWYSYQKFPLVDMHWILSQYYPVILNYIKQDISLEHLDERLNFHPLLWQAKKKENSYCIVEDEYHNAFEIVRQFTTRSNNEAFINVIASSYLLQDYMMANEDIFYHDPKAIPSFVPDFSFSYRNLLLGIIIKMMTKAISKQEIEKQLHLYLKPELELKQFLNQEICHYFTSQEIDLIVENKEMYYIEDKALIQKYLKELTFGYYVAENNYQEKLGSSLLGQINQRYLPYQYVTINGKYYEVLSTSENYGLYLRRCADHLNGRYYYRQIRNYNFDKGQEKIVSNYTLNHIQLEKAEYDFHVDTLGYYKMNQYNDFNQAKKIELNDCLIRHYKNKLVLKIKFENASEELYQTLTILFNELFLTIYPNNYEYIVAVTSYNNDKLIQTYFISGIYDQDAIYIIEDSQLDLGLLDSFERNLTRFLEIITDYLLWHFEAVKPIEEIEEVPNAHIDLQAKDINPNNEKQELMIVNKKIVKNIIPEYAKNYYLLYGFDELPIGLHLERTRDFLISLGFDKNLLFEARNLKITEFNQLEYYDFNDHRKIYCDFCGKELSGSELEILQDGRKRCANCGHSAIRNYEDFIKVYRQVKNDLYTYFHVQIDVGIEIKVTDAKTLHKKINRHFIPGSNSGRVLGLAIKNNSHNFTIYLENGAPRLAMMTTLIHELTHIWQYANFNERELKKIYGKEHLLEIYEGMAKWVEIQYLYLLKEKIYARRQELIILSNDNEYSKGYKYYTSAYPINRKNNILKNTPFYHIEKPLP